MNSSKIHWFGRSTAQLHSKRNNRGFTLIELLIVVSIIGILAAIAVPNYQWGIIKAKEAVLRETLYNFRNIIDQFHADQGKYPEKISDLKDKGYMREIPKDPFTNSAESWVEVPVEVSSPPPEGTDIGKVFDVKSGSEKLSPTTNTPYRDW